MDSKTMQVRASELNPDAKSSNSFFAKLFIGNHLPVSPRWQSWFVRGQSGLTLISLFYLIVKMGPSGLVLLTYAVQLGSFYEATELAFKITGCERLRMWSWQLLLVANIYLGDADYYKIVDPSFERYVEPFCYLAYLFLIFWFLISIENKENCIASYCHFAWVHMVILFTTFQASLVLRTLQHGTVWYIFAMIIITVNDIMAYMFGFFIGSRPLIILSPKKTLEGFIGGGIATVILGPMMGQAFLSVPELLCPAPGLQVSECDPYSMWLYSGSSPPFIFHTFIISIFASTVGPTAGFLCSGFKRACHAKNFGNLIPGHGGVLDRCDCMFLMASFTYIYLNHFVIPSVENHAAPA